MRGAIYVATGERYVDATIRSAVSLRKVMPNIRIALASDQPAPDPFDDELRVPPDDGYRAKILALKRSPYRRTLMLDVDTHVVKDLSELFVILDRFDIALAHAPNRIMLPLDDVPDSYPEFNTGVIVLKHSRVVQRLLKDWLEEYDRLAPRRPPSRDQASFRRVSYYSSKLRIATLVPKFNLRFNMAGFINKSVRVLHGWPGSATYESVARAVNDPIKSANHRSVFAAHTLFDQDGRPIARLD